MQRTLCNCILTPFVPDHRHIFLCSLSDDKEEEKIKRKLGSESKIINEIMNSESSRHGTNWHISPYVRIERACQEGKKLSDSVIKRKKTCKSSAIYYS